MTMIEQVAAFLKLRDESLLTGEADDGERAESAREIIGLMREPTEAMLDVAGGGAKGVKRSLWRLMIDAAINEQVSA